MEKLKAHIKDITNISDEDFEHIKTFFTLKKVKKHQHLIQEDEQVKFEFLILSGIFRAFTLTLRGKNILFSLLQKTGGSLTMLHILNNCLPAQT